MRGQKGDFPFGGPALEMCPLTGKGFCETQSSLVLVDVSFGQFENKEVLFAEPSKMFHVLLLDYLALFEGRPLELARADLGDVVGQDLSNGLVHSDHSGRRLVFGSHAGFDILLSG